jgi:hypothetical protein
MFITTGSLSKKPKMLVSSDGTRKSLTCSISERATLQGVPDLQRDNAGLPGPIAPDVLKLHFTQQLKRHGYEFCWHVTHGHFMMRLRMKIA